MREVVHYESPIYSSSFFIQWSMRDQGEARKTILLIEWVNVSLLTRLYFNPSPYPFLHFFILLSFLFDTFIKDTMITKINFMRTTGKLSFYKKKKMI